MKNGFTLIEVLATVALIGILTTMVGISIGKIKEDTVNNLYDSKVIYIESGAKEWGNDNINELSSDDCAEVLVETLITDGYIIGDNDDKSVLQNPLNVAKSDGMNDMKVCVKYEAKNNSKTVTAKLVEE